MATTNLPDSAEQHDNKHNVGKSAVIAVITATSCRLQSNSRGVLPLRHHLLPEPHNLHFPRPAAGVPRGHGPSSLTLWQPQPHSVDRIQWLPAASPTDGGRLVVDQLHERHHMGHLCDWRVAAGRSAEQDRAARRWLRCAARTLLCAVHQDME